DGPVGHLAKLQNQFFKFNGLTWWTDVSRAAAGRIISAEMGMRAATNFDKLPPKYRHVLGLHGIDAQRWQIVQSLSGRTIEGKTYIPPDMMRDIPDSAIEPLVQSRVNAERARADAANP